MTKVGVRITGFGRQAIGFAVLLLLLAAITPARANVIVVTTTDDELNADSDCSLREAIWSANMDSSVAGCDTGGNGADEIVFDAALAGSPLYLVIAGAGENGGLTGDLDIFDDLAIHGAGAASTIVDGADLDRVFHVVASVTVEFSGLTVRNGSVIGSGGGIAGRATVRDCRITENDATADGGGLADVSVIERCTVSLNVAEGRGGGIALIDQLSISISDTTIYSNGASLAGGLYNSATPATITRSTFSENWAPNVGAIWHGGASGDQTMIISNATIGRNVGDYSVPAILNAGSAQMELRNTIVDENTGYFVGEDNCVGSASSYGHNLFGATGSADCPAHPTDVLGPRAGLGSFTDAGAPGFGHFSMSHFGAGIDAGNDIVCGSVDQIGGTRDVDGNLDGVVQCDIGAIEYRPLVVTKTADTFDGVCDADCSLREALVAANATPGDNGIVVPQGLFTLGIEGRHEDAGLTGDLDVTDNLMVLGVGPEETLVDAAGIDRALHLVAGNLDLRGVGLHGGDADLGGCLAANAGTEMTVSDCVLSNCVGDFGGAIGQAGTLHISDSAIRNNEARDNGGGLWSIGSERSTVDDCRFEQNAAGSRGGAIFNRSGMNGDGELEISHTTIRLNTAVESGGGIHNEGEVSVDFSSILENDGGSLGGGIFSAGDLVLVRSTVAFNQAMFVAAIVNDGQADISHATITENVARGDAGFSNSGTAYLTNTILAGNVVDTYQSSLVDCVGSLTSLGYNIFGQDCEGGIDDDPTDLFTDDPGLDDLQSTENPGGEHLPALAGGPAVDTGIISGCVGTDQIGTHRPLDSDGDETARCERGAVELAAQTARVVPSAGDPPQASTIAACTFIDVSASEFSLGGYGATLSWDPEVLLYLSYTGGDFPFDDPVVNDADATEGALAFADADATGSGGPVHVACFEFQAIGAPGSATSLDLGLSSMYAAGSFTDLQPGTSVLDTPIDIVDQCLIGDPDGDNVVNSGDALLILADELLLPIPFTVEESLDLDCGDGNGDDATNSIDANLVLAYEVGLPIDPEFPIGTWNVVLDSCPVCADGAAKCAGATVASEARGVWFELVPLGERVRGDRRVEVALTLDLGSDERSLGSYAAKLEWDPESLTLVGTTGGRTPGFASPMVNRAGIDRGTLRFGQATPRGASGRVEIARFEFLARQRTADLLQLVDTIDVTFTSMGASWPTFEDLTPAIRQRTGSSRRAGG